MRFPLLSVYLVSAHAAHESGTSLKEYVIPTGTRFHLSGTGKQLSCVIWCRGDGTSKTPNTSSHDHHHHRAPLVFDALTLTWSLAFNYVLWWHETAHENIKMCGWDTHSSPKYSDSIPWDHASLKSSATCQNILQLKHCGDACMTLSFL